MLSAAYSSQFLHILHKINLMGSESDLISLEYGRLYYAETKNTSASLQGVEGCVNSRNKVPLMFFTGAMKEKEADVPLRPSMATMHILYALYYIEHKCVFRVSWYETIINSSILLFVFMPP
jgi:hypothetical protein